MYPLNKTHIERVLQSMILLFAFLLTNSAKAQDPQFSQFYANSLYLNPALTGNTNQLRMATTYRNQWPSIPKGFVSYTAAIDYNFSEANSGLGFLVTHDKAGTGGLQFTNLGLLYSPYVRLSRLVYLKGGVKFSYTSRNINVSQFTFSDQIIRDGAPSTVEQLGEGVNHLDLAAGIVLANTEKYWFGVAVDHLNQPDYSFLQTESTLPVKTSIHGGWNFELRNSSRISRPNNLKAIVHYKFQGKWDQLDFGSYYETDPIILGLWYRGIPFFKRYETAYNNNESMIVMLGVKSEKLRISYSYDVTISRLARNSGGAHEISLVYEVANKRKKRRKGLLLVPCPKF